MFFNRSIQEILLTIPGILIGLSFHEFAHAFVSDKLGDPTPRMQGRLTLSPLPHLDIIGFILIILAGFGWAKPVQINTRYYKHPRRDDILVSVAGPVMNLLLAVIFTLILKLIFIAKIGTSIDGTLFGYIYLLFYYTIWINVILSIFNLIPIPPLDGFSLLSNFLPFRSRNILYYLERYGFIILIGLMMFRFTSYIIVIPAQYVFSFLFNLLGVPLL